jgi:Skp family chaperone for outer membrane proteins
MTKFLALPAVLGGALLLAACGSGGELADKMIRDLSKRMVPEAAECVAQGVVAKLNEQQKAVALAAAVHDEEMEAANRLNEEERKKAAEGADKKLAEAREKANLKEDPAYQKVLAQIGRVVNDVMPACVN